MARFEWWARLMWVSSSAMVSEVAAELLVGYIGGVAKVRCQVHLSRHFEHFMICRVLITKIKNSLQRFNKSKWGTSRLRLLDSESMSIFHEVWKCWVLQGILSISYCFRKVCLCINTDQVSIYDNGKWKLWFCYILNHFLHQNSKILSTNVLVEIVCFWCDLWKWFVVKIMNDNNVDGWINL